LRRGSGQFSGRALVVDDSATIRRQLQLVLGDQGVEVEVADNGELALQLLSTREFDIVLLDVMLPGADGYQICKAIKRNRTRKPPPVVMLTSRSSPFDRVRGSLAGCDGYITKPASLARIKEAVARYLAPAGNVRIDTAAP
ncbi:MAG TPA: response regulator, partial [Bryobacteraceae bacterium]|nr:response regulator [Bryobacteraceae bacterium]